jgi:hypothetical protein
LTDIIPRDPNEEQLSVVSSQLSEKTSGPRHVATRN